MTDEAVTTGGAFDVMGGSSVALLGYNVVRIQCKTAGGLASVPLPTGFHARAIITPLVGTCKLNSDGKSVAITDATKDAVFFLIGQN